MSSHELRKGVKLDKQNFPNFGKVHEFEQHWWTYDTPEDELKIQEDLKYASPRALKKKRSETLRYYSTDTRAQYRTNMKDRPEQMEDFGWVKPENQFVYNFNHYGYRDEEFTDYDDCWIAAGECFTLGTGLPEELVWVSKLQEKLGTKIWNLGQCTTGFDTSVRVIMAWIDTLKPSKVLVVEPPPCAREIYENGIPSFLGFWNDYEWQRALADDKHELHMARRKNFWALQGICHQRGIELHIISTEERHQIAVDSWGEVNTGEYAVARDLMHPGWHFQEQMFQRWMKEL